MGLLLKSYKKLRVRHIIYSSAGFSRRPMLVPSHLLTSSLVYHHTMVLTSCLDSLFSSSRSS